MERGIVVVVVVVVVGILLLSSGTEPYKSNDQVTVTTTDGNVIGLKKIVLEKVVYCFLGIPFAKPPIGKLRFKNPEPMEKWTTYKWATEMPKTCYQNLPELHELNNPALRMWLNNTEMSEDCLYLNIWTPRLNQKGYEDEAHNIPAMVWIHGGGFTSGSSTLDVYNGEILASKMNVILVSIQYRLGPFGFLSFNVKDIPGNQGLMDQVLALKWINNNIAKFGGNRKKITIFGENAGAVSASFHLLSPLTQTLFNQAIMQSGSALSTWAYDTPKSAIEKARQLAELSGCHVFEELSKNSSSDLYECLRYLDPVTLSVNQWRMQIFQNAFKRSRQNKLKQQYKEKFNKLIMTTANLYFDIPFKPVIGSEYLPMPPIYYLAKNHSSINKRRVMLGVTKNEGLINLIRGLRMYFMSSESQIVKPRQFRKGSAEFDPSDLLSFYLLEERFIHHFLIQAITFEYQLPSRLFGKTDWKEDDVIRVLDNIAGDYSFKCPIVDFVDLYLQISRVYLYSFEHETKYITLPKWTGVLQGQEVPYIFGKPFDAKFKENYFNFTEEEKELSLNIMTFWTNFAQIGDPNHASNEYNARKTGMSWDMYTESNSIYSTIYPNFQSGRKHIVFNNKTVYNDKNLRRHECLFWREYLPNLLRTLLEDTKCPPRSSSLQKTTITGPQHINVTKQFDRISNPLAKPSKTDGSKNNRKLSSRHHFHKIIIFITCLLVQMVDNY